MNPLDLWDLLWEWRKRVKEKSSVYMGRWDKEQPTQQDKPSAHSSLTLYEAKEKLRDAFSWRTFKVFNVANTNSMEPFIDANSVVLAEKISTYVLNKQPLEEGDICIYDNGKGSLIIHRIWKKDNLGQKFYFKGDNNFFADGWIKKEQIVYRYVGQLQTRQLLEGD
jgi:signal peptidase I